ncbi:MAG TPA: aldo/keto reductase [Armatimonadota bacterium]|nr:aldo/keto reductase [Armatimonadota bacterium]
MRSSRRRFIQTTAAALGAMPLSSLLTAQGESWKMNYRPFGTTGLQVSEVSLGGHFDGPGWEDKDARSQDLRNAVIDRAIERGINFFDTNYDYEREQLGIALEGKRDKIILASDVNNREGVNKKATRETIRRRIDEHLKMLRTDRIDIFRLMAGVEHPTDPQMEGVLEAFGEMKDEGLASFLALSIHDPTVLAENLRKWGSEIDLCYCPFSYVTPRLADELLPTAAELGVGVICIKPFAKGTLFQLPEDDPRMEGIDPGNISLARANLKWILSHEAVSTVIPGMELPSEVDDNVLASGAGGPTAEETALLERVSPIVRHSLPEHYAWLRRWHV